MIGIDNTEQYVGLDERYEEITLEGCKKLCIDLHYHTCSAVAYDIKVRHIKGIEFRITSHTLTSSIFIQLEKHLHEHVTSAESHNAIIYRQCACKV